MTGGGTGGHVNPAIAIANTIKANIPDAEIAFVGTKNGIENRLVSAEGYSIYHVEVMGIRRSLSPANIKAIYLAFVSPIKAKKIIREFKPDIVIGTGGYVSWPILKAAAKMGVPTAVHESNAVPGLTVKMVQGMVDRVFVNFRETTEYITEKDKVMHVGNPLRSGFGTCSKAEAKQKLGISNKYRNFVLAYGGSLGAEKVTSATLELMKIYAPLSPDTLFLLGTGKSKYAEAREQYLAMGLDKYKNVEIVDYIMDMPLRMSAADVVISRAGAMTLSELSMMRKAAVLIPSPNVTNNHQYKNAKVLADAGAAVMIEEEELARGRLVDEITELLENEDKRTHLEKNISEFALLDANKLIFEEVLRLTEKK